MKWLAVLVVGFGLLVPASAGAASPSCDRALNSADRIDALFNEFAKAVSDHIATAPVDANIAEMGASYGQLADRAEKIGARLAIERKKYARYAVACRR